MKHQDSGHWEGLAQREAYFPVLAPDGSAIPGNAQSADEFFATGEADVSTLLAALRSLLERELVLESVLDFGCGAGRLTLPLARRAKRVVACDVAPTVLVHARQNADAAGLSNIDFVLLSESTPLPDQSFDFICSLLVFQYVPASEGYGLIRALARQLASGGIAAIQMRFGTSRRPRPLSRSGSRVEDALHLKMYNERRAVQSLKSAGAEHVARLAVGSDGSDAILIFKRSSISPVSG